MREMGQTCYIGGDRMIMCKGCGYYDKDSFAHLLICHMGQGEEE